jgi:hypothetical protein
MQQEEERECSADICIIHTSFNGVPLGQYINNNSQARVEPSAEEKNEKNLHQLQEKQEGGVEQQQDVVVIM